MRSFPATLALLPLLAGCGAQGAPQPADDGSGDDTALSGEYVADGLPAPFSEGDVLRVGFGDGEVSFSATCNQMSGTAGWGSGTLDVSSVGGTEMGCPGDGFAQDEWLVDFFTSRPAVTVDGTDVRLASGRTEIWLVPADELAPGGTGPDVALEGAHWRLTGIEEADGDSVGILVVPNKVEAWVEIDSGQVRFRAGCNAGGGPAEVVDDRLELGEVAIELVGCQGVEAEIERLSVPVLMADSVRWSVTGDELRLTRGDTTLVYGAE